MPVSGAFLLQVPEFLPDYFAFLRTAAIGQWGFLRGYVI
jgi:hypothetical protein